MDISARTSFQGEETLLKEKMTAHQAADLIDIAEKAGPIAHAAAIHNSAVTTAACTVCAWRNAIYFETAATLHWAILFVQNATFTAHAINVGYAGGAALRVDRTDAPIPWGSTDTCTVCTAATATAVLVLIKVIAEAARFAAASRYWGQWAALPIGF